VSTRPDLAPLAEIARQVADEWECELGPVFSLSQFSYAAPADDGAVLWNPIPYRKTVDITERRIAAFAAAGLEEERIRKWAIIRGAYLGADAEEVPMLRALVA
jgi:hypothetical protein